MFNKKEIWFLFFNPTGVRLNKSYKILLLREKTAYSQQNHTPINILKIDLLLSTKENTISFTIDAKMYVCKFDLMLDDRLFENSKYYIWYTSILIFIV